MTVLHGENTTRSRAELGKMMDQARQQGSVVTRLEAKKLTLAELEEALQATSLFNEPKLVVIEELHSLPTSNRKKELIAYLADFQPADNVSLILWEKRALTATMLKKLGNPKAQEFKLSKALFQWLDSINGKRQKPAEVLKLFHQAVEQEGEYLCFLMLARQIRMMIQVLDGGQPKGPPFMIQKIKNQAQSFSLERLLTLHRQLLEIDYRQKTSASPFDLTQELDLLLANL